MTTLQEFIRKYKEDLSDIVIGGGWAIEIMAGIANNPVRDHHDIDTIVLKDKLLVRSDSHHLPLEYFWSVNVKSKEELEKFVEEYEVEFSGKTYTLRVLCPEFILVSKTFSRVGLPRPKDNGDVERIFSTFDLDKEKLEELIEKSSLLRAGSVFLDFAERALGITGDRETLNRELFSKKYGFGEKAKSLSAEELEDYHSALCEVMNQVSKEMRDELIENGLMERLLGYELGQAGIFSRAIARGLKYSSEIMKERVAKKLLEYEPEQAMEYGRAIYYGLQFSPEIMKERVLERLLEYESGQAMEYGRAIYYGLQFSPEIMKERVLERLLEHEPGQAMEY